MTDGDLIDQFLSSLTKHTRRAYRKDLRTVFGRRRFDLACLADLEVRPHSSSASVNKRQIAAVKSFCRWLAEGGHIPHSSIPRFPIIVQTTSSKLRMPTREDVNRLLYAARTGSAPVRDHALIRVILEAGLRRSEVTGLDVGTVRWSTIGPILNLGETRGRSDTWVVITDRLYGELQDVSAYYNLASGPLFISLSNNSYGERLTSQSVYRIVVSTAHTAGVPKLTADSLRLRSSQDRLEELEIMTPERATPTKSRFYLATP